MSTPCAVHTGPVVAAIFVGDALHTAGADGRVLRWAITGDRFGAAACVYEDPDSPVYALAVHRGVLLGLDAHALRSFGPSPTSASLPGCDAIAARGDVVLVAGSGRLIALAKSDNGYRVVHELAIDDGPIHDLDIDRSGKRAIVLHANRRLDLIDLTKRARIAAWTASLDGLRFGEGADDLWTAGEYELFRVKAKTGNKARKPDLRLGATGRTIVVDASGTHAAIGVDGEDVMVVPLRSLRVAMHFVTDPTPTPEKLLAGLHRIPRFREIAPGILRRTGSCPAPPQTIHQSALAIADDGSFAAAGYLSGEVVRLEVATGRIDAAIAGPLTRGRCIAAFEVPATAAFTRVDDTLLAIGDTQAIEIDLAKRSASTVAPPCAWAGLDRVVDHYIRADASAITYVGWDTAACFRRSDGARIGGQPLPRHRGAIPWQGGVLWVPEDSATLDGFTIEHLDLETGERRIVSHHLRDPERFPVGPDATKWMHLALLATRPILLVWCGQGFVAANAFTLDVDTAIVGDEIPAALQSWWFSKKHGHGDRLVAHGRDYTLGVWDVETLASLAHIELGEQRSRTLAAAYSPASGRIAAAVVRSRIAVWEKDGTESIAIPGCSAAAEMWLSSDGRTLATDDRGVVRLWDVT